MKRLAKLLPLVLLPLACASGCGGSTALPTLLLNVSGMPEMTARIDTVVSNAGRSMSASFYRDSTNSYVSTPTGMPPMLPSPANVQLAFDLPEKTTGPVKVTLSFMGIQMQQMMMPMGSLMVLEVGCAMADVSAGGLITVPVTAMAPPAVCP